MASQPSAYNYDDEENDPLDDEIPNAAIQERDQEPTFEFTGTAGTGPRNAGKYYAITIPDTDMSHDEIRQAFDDAAEDHPGRRIEWMAITTEDHSAFAPRPIGSQWGLRSKHVHIMVKFQGERMRMQARWGERRRPRWIDKICKDPDGNFCMAYVQPCFNAQGWKGYMEKEGPATIYGGTREEWETQLEQYAIREGQMAGPGGAGAPMNNTEEAVRLVVQEKWRATDVIKKYPKLWRMMNALKALENA